MDWDEYLPDNLKADTRTKIGRGMWRQVEPSSSIPGNWQAFLHIGEKKVELFSFLVSFSCMIALAAMSMPMIHHVSNTSSRSIEK